MSRSNYTERWLGKSAVLIALLCAAGILAGMHAQTVSKTSTSQTATVKILPPRPAEACCGYPFPRETDAEVADGDVHRVHYEDAHIMLIEVSNPPCFMSRCTATPSLLSSRMTPTPDPAIPPLPMCRAIRSTVDRSRKHIQRYGRQHGSCTCRHEVAHLQSGCSPGSARGTVQHRPCPQSFLSPGIPAR